MSREDEIKDRLKQLDQATVPEDASGEGVFLGMDAVNTEAAELEGELRGLKAKESVAA
jgi:hypothetical protein